MRFFTQRLNEILRIHVSCIYIYILTYPQQNETNQEHRIFNI